MLRRKPRVVKTEFVHTSGVHKVLVTLFEEQRASYRFSMTTRGLNVRVPLGIQPKSRAEIIEKALQWWQALIEKKPMLSDFNTARNWKDGDLLEVGALSFVLRIMERIDIKNHKAAIKENEIVIQIAANDTEDHKKEAISSLLSRLMGSKIGPIFSKRVMELNQLYFNRPIKNITYRHNHSRWGSCSSRSTLSFSTRIFFAPQIVQDYLIIHELAHLIEMNHSDRFWALVEKAMPNYLEQEAWLKKYGHGCQY